MDVGLLNAYVRCLAAYAIHTAEASDGKIESTSDVVMTNANSPSLWRNMVVPLRELSAAEWAALQTNARRFFGSAPWTIWSPFVLSDLPRGLIEVQSNPIMARADSAPITLGHTDSPLSIDEVVDGDGVRLFERIRIDARLAGDQKRTPLTGTTSLHKAGDSEIFGVKVLSAGHRMWIGYVHGTPVSTGASFAAEGVNMIKGISTLPHYRHRGYGRAISARAVNAVRAPAVLDSDPLAKGLYQSLGFEGIGRVTFITPDQNTLSPATGGS